MRSALDRRSAWCLCERLAALATLPMNTQRCFRQTEKTRRIECDPSVEPYSNERAN